MGLSFYHRGNFALEPEVSHLLWAQTEEAPQRDSQKKTIGDLNSSDASDPDKEQVSHNLSKHFQGN